jgi:hypothetical protein
MTLNHRLVKPGWLGGAHAPAFADEDCRDDACKLRDDGTLPTKRANRILNQDSAGQLNRDVLQANKEKLGTRDLTSTDHLV